MEEMNIPLMYVVSFVCVTAFVAIYALLVAPKRFSTGLAYGALLGLSAGMSMGFGSYAYMPIPLGLAGTWFLAAFTKSVLAGALVGALVKDPPRQN